MKRTIAIIAAALSLSACGTTEGLIPVDAIARVAEGALTEPTSTAKGATSGMSSSDAANVLMNRDYYAAVKAVATGSSGTGKGAVQFEIEAHDGRPITIDAKALRTYHAPQAQYAGGGGLTLKAPPTVESTGIKWFREIKEAVVDTVEVVLPWKLVREQGKTIRHESNNATATRQAELSVINNAVTGSQGIAGQAIQTYKPAATIIIPGSGSASTTTEAAAE